MHRGQITLQKWNVLKPAKCSDRITQLTIYYDTLEKENFIYQHCAHVVLGRIRADFLFNNYAFMVINADDIIYKSNVSFLYAVLSFLISFCYCIWNFFMIFILQQHCIFFVFQYYIHIETSLTTQNILLKFSFNEN